MWKAENEEAKASWKAKADEVKENHLKQHPGYSYQPRKPSEKKRRMTKRKAAALQSRASAAAPVTNDQIAVAPQLPLPSFSFSPDNPMLMEFTFGQDFGAIETFGQMIDQHNHSQLVFDHNASSAAISSNGFANVPNDYDFIGAVVSSAQLDHINAGLAVDNATVGGLSLGGESFVVGGTGGVEQERQELLGNDIFDWDAFGQSAFAGYETTV
jgi:hypothetical protein